MSELSNRDRLGLQFLACVEGASPADIGYALTPNRAGRALRPQGAGRIGSSWAVRASKRGLVRNASYRNGGYPAYEITAVGRKAIMEGDEK